MPKRLYTWRTLLGLSTLISARAPKVPTHSSAPL